MHIQANIYRHRETMQNLKDMLQGQNYVRIANRIKMWDRLLRLPSNRHLFFLGVDIIWLSDRDDLDQPSPAYNRVSDVILLQKPPTLHWPGTHIVTMVNGNDTQ